MLHPPSCMCSTPCELASRRTRVHAVPSACGFVVWLSRILAVSWPYSASARRHFALVPRCVGVRHAVRVFSCRQLDPGLAPGSLLAATCVVYHQVSACPCSRCRVRLRSFMLVCWCACRSEFVCWGDFVHLYARRLAVLHARRPSNSHVPRQALVYRTRLYRHPFTSCRQSVQSRPPACCSFPMLLVRRLAG